MTYEQAIVAAGVLFANNEKVTTQDIESFSEIWNRQIAGTITVDQAMTEGAVLIDSISRRQT
jgi:hypothetical protein